MPIRDLITVEAPSVAVHKRAFSTEFRLFSRDELMSIDRRYGHCNTATFGAIYDRSGEIVEMSQRDGGRAGDLVVGLDPPSVIKREALRNRTFLRGRTLFLGHYMNLYGHFLIETMSRFWGIATGTFDHYAFFPFAAHEGKILSHPFHQQFLDHFGIPAARMVILRAPVEFEEIHVPDRLCTINYRANIRLPDVYQHMARKYRTTTGKDRIFLSRLQPYARISNVPEVEEVFRELDFKIIYPETLDLHAQIEHYASCRILAGFAGSALHNCLFSQDGTALIELGDIRSPNRPLSTQSFVNQAACVDARFIPYKGSPEGGMDTDNLRRALLDVAIIERNGRCPEDGTGFQSRSFANHYLWPATLIAHVANFGDAMRTGDLLLDAPRDGRSHIEGLSIALDATAPFGIEYRILQHNGSWSDWSGPGVFLGTRGVAQPIRGYAVRLTGLGAQHFRCVCLGQFAGHAGVVEAVDGEGCAAKDRALLKGLQLKLQRMAGSFKALLANAVADPGAIVREQQSQFGQ